MIEIGLMLICLGLIIIWCELRLIEHRKIEREKIFEKWLFDSLYAIDNRVLLPTEHEKPTTKKKATVYIPGKDPMAEFTGKQDDWNE